MNTKKIGLLLSDEDDWPVAFEQLHRRLEPRFPYRGGTLQTEVERVRIHPFNLAAPTAYDLVIDRLAYWHFPPARMAEEGHAGQRRLPAQQPLHLPEHGEALGLLRHDPAGAAHPGHLADPHQDRP